MIYHWIIHDPPLDHTWSTIGSSMIHHWIIYDPPLDHLSSTMDHYWIIHDPMVDHPWFTIGSSMIHHWIIHDPPLDHPWSTIGSSMIHHWIIYHPLRTTIESFMIQMVDHLWLIHNLDHPWPWPTNVDSPFYSPCPFMMDHAVKNDLIWSTLFLTSLESLVVLRQGNFSQNFTRKFPETFGTKVWIFLRKLSLKISSKFHPKFCKNFR